MTSEEWRGIVIALAIFVAMFSFPIITLWRDERRTRRAADTVTAQPSEDNVTARPSEE